MRRFILIIAIFIGVLWGGPVGAGEAFDRAVADYERGDYEEALNGFRVLAVKGVAESQYNLGFMYRKGQGVPQDDAEAAKWLRKAAEQGEPTAQYSLGLMYSKGQGVRQDDAEAVKWYRKAADQGVAKAQHNLGQKYGIGLGVPQDFVLADMWFNLAAAQGNKLARKALDIVVKAMTPAQIGEAQRLAREWRAKK